MTATVRFSSESLPPALYEHVIRAIGRARTRAARIRIALFSALIMVSGGGFALAIRSTLHAARASGFTTFASLALSDTSIIAQHAREFALSLVETLPGIEVAATLLGAAVFLVSVRGLLRVLSQVQSDTSTRSSISHI